MFYRILHRNIYIKKREVFVFQITPEEQFYYSQNGDGTPSCRVDTKFLYIWRVVK